MNETPFSTLPPGTPDPARNSSDPRARVPDTSMLPGSEKAPPPVVDLLNHAVQGAHDALDRLADRVQPVAQQLGEQVSAAEAALQAQTAQLRQTGDEWTESLRSSVRSNPLMAIAAAAMLGAVLARLTQDR